MTLDNIKINVFFCEIGMIIKLILKMHSGKSAYL